MIDVDMKEVPEYELFRYKIERVGITRTKLAEILDVSYDVLNNYLYGRSDTLSATIKRYMSGFLDTIESIESVYNRNNFKSKED